MGDDEQVRACSGVLFELGSLIEVQTVLERQWMDLSPASLGALRALIERYVSAYAWDPMFAFVLETPTWVVFATIGILLYLSGRRRERVNIFAN